MTGELDLTSHEWSTHERVIVFDGICNWCNTWVNFTIEHDPHRVFKFATLQSQPAQQLLKDLRLPTEDFETFLLLEQGRIFTKSTAALKILKELSGYWPLFYLGIMIPRSLRDTVYDYLARRRYRWMGKADTCRVSTSAERERFL